MDAEEVKLYESQLAQVESALAGDPSNAELQNLRDELVNLISLTKSLQGGGSGAAETAKVATRETAAPSAGPSKPTSAARSSARPKQDEPTKRYAAGEDVSAKYAGDGRWYPARVVSVGGATDNPVYSIIFKGYNNTELLTSADLRPSTKPQVSSNTSASASPTPGGGSASASPAPPSAAANGKKPMTEDDAERERKRRRNEKKVEKISAKQAAQVDKQAAWQKFAKKGVKKGVIPGQKSIFKTPDDPYAKVGVVGGGRGMTSYNSRSKHVYEGAEGQQ